MDLSRLDFTSYRAETLTTALTADEAVRRMRDSKIAIRWFWYKPDAGKSEDGARRVRFTATQTDGKPFITKLGDRIDAEALVTEANGQTHVDMRLRYAPLAVFGTYLLLALAFACLVFLAVQAVRGLAPVRIPALPIAFTALVVLADRVTLKRRAARLTAELRKILEP